MKTIKKIQKYVVVALAFCGMAMIQSCKEEVDTSNQFTFTEYTVASYLEEHLESYSEYYTLLNQVKISKRSASTVLQLLTARGNYTVFAPTNQAIQNYLVSLAEKGIITTPSWEGFQTQETLDSIRKVIVFNSVIDSGDNLSAYQTSSFRDGEEISISNLNDRKLVIVFDDNDANLIYVNGIKDKDTKEITGGALINVKNRDIVAINGYIHQVEDVIAPSDQSLGDWLKDLVDLHDENYSVMADLILTCGLKDTLSKERDEVYEDMYLNGHIEDVYSSVAGKIEKVPQHRKYGFTIFAEKNDFWEREIGKPATDITPADVQNWVLSKGYYTDGLNNTDYANPENVLNQFITYHILPMRLPINKLVIHYNEKGYYYNPESNPYTIPVWEIYTSMGKRRLVKLYEGGPSALDQGIFINRFPVLDNGRHGTYHEVEIKEGCAGIKINTSEAQNVINGYIYPIDQEMVYDEKTKDNFQKQRLRYDVAGLFPEFMNNDIRANRDNKEYTAFPITKTYNYLENVKIEEGTNFIYLPGIGYTWQNLQGDELNVTGRYEMIFKMPPVPKKGTYEIRYAVQSHSDRRGMCQVYFGTNLNHLPAMGIPLDLRLGRTTEDQKLIGYEDDSPTDDDYNAEIDKKMRNYGFMKGAEAYHAGNLSSQTARNVPTTTRRIIVRQEMDPDKTYYLKFKSVLEAEDKEFYMDYIEFCSKEVYDNPSEPEDIW